jgi:hypothetical protein
VRTDVTDDLYHAGMIPAKRRTHGAGANAVAAPEMKQQLSSIKSVIHCRISVHCAPMNDTSRSHGDGHRARCASFADGDGRRATKKEMAPAERPTCSNRPTVGVYGGGMSAPACPGPCFSSKRTGQAARAFIDATTAPKA